MSASDVLNKINEYGVKFVDFRFTDTKGKEQHVTVPARTERMVSRRFITTLVRRSPAFRAIIPSLLSVCRRRESGDSRQVVCRCVRL